MFKKIAIVTMSLVVAFGFTACSSNPYSSYDLKDYIKVGEYKGLEVVEKKVSVTDEDVNEEIKSRLQEAATTETVEKGKVEEGDTVTITYEGKIDGKTFDGGSAENYELTIGSGQFIDGFEDGLIGAEVGGDPVTLKLKFPDNYSDDKVAGKDVEFTVTVTAKQSSKVPELDMDFVKSTGSKAKSLDAYKKEVKKDIEKQKKAEVKDEQKGTLWQTLVDSSEVKKDKDGKEKYPQDEIDRVYDSYIEEYKTYAESYNMEYDEFVSQYTGMEKKDFEKQVKDYAKVVVKQEEILYYIVDKENLKISKKEYNEYIAEQLEAMGYTEDEYEAAMGTSFEENMGEDNIRRNIYMDKVTDLMLKEAKTVEKASTEESEKSDGSK